MSEEILTKDLKKGYNFFNAKGQNKILGILSSSTA